MQVVHLDALQGQLAVDDDIRSYLAAAREDVRDAVRPVDSGQVQPVVAARAAWKSAIVW